jgi:hypothetical protein
MMITKSLRNTLDNLMKMILYELLIFEIVSLYARTRLC